MSVHGETKIIHCRGLGFPRVVAQVTNTRLPLKNSLWSTLALVSKA